MSDWTVLPGYAQTQPRNSPQAPDQWEVISSPGQKQPNPSRTGGWEVVSIPGQPTVAERPGTWELLKSGTAQVGQAAGGLLEAFGPGTLDESGQRLREESTKQMVPTMSLEQLGVGYDKLDWSNPADVTKWLGSTLANTPQFIKENVVSQIPNMGVSAAGAYSGAALGGLIGGAFGAGAGAVPGAKIGALAGTFAASYFLNAGETFADLREKGVSRDAAAETAGFTGAAKGVLDSVLPAKLFGSLAAKTGMKTFWVPKDLLGSKPALAKALFSGAGIEGGTEAGQELLDMWAEQAHGVYTPGQGLSRTLNAAAAGAAGGGVFSGAAYAAERVASRNIEAESHPVELDEAPPDTAPASPVEPNRPLAPESVTPEQAPSIIREKLLSMGGTESLVKSYDAEELKTILQIPSDEGLRRSIDAGLIEPVGDRFRMTEGLIGPLPMKPVEGVPGMFKGIAPSDPEYTFISPVAGETFQVDLRAGDDELGITDAFITMRDGEEISAPTLGELSAKLVGTEPTVAEPVQPPAPHTPEQVETISRLFPTASIEQQPDNALLIKGDKGVVMKLAPNGTIVVETPPAPGSKTEARLGEPGSVVTGVTRVLTSAHAAYLGGVRGTEVQVDPSMGADRQTLLHEFGWHTFLELGATPEQRKMAQALFPDEEDGARAFASYLEGSWTARDQARSKFLFDLVAWFKNLYYQMTGKAEALFNEAGRGDWINNAPAPSRSLGEQYEIKRQEDLAKSNTFFSQLERVVEEKVPKVAPAPQVIGILTNPQNAVKAEELRWSGIIDWLKERGMNKVTQEELWAKVRENQVQITEVPKGSIADAMRKQDRGWDNIFALGDAYERGEISIDWLESERARLLQETQTASDRIRTNDPTKFSQWQVPGGEDYTELLMTLPEKVGNTTGWDAVDSEDANLGYPPGPEEAHTNFISSHWDEPNVLAHTRFNSREVSGKNTLFIEEIQSDWHQAGRKEGYGNKIPDAPLRNSWHELVFKRLLRYAAENGYDQVAWTNGETQNDRYDLSKHASRVNYVPSTQVLKVWNLKDERIHTETYAPEKLPDVIGKEIAQRLLNTPLEDDFLALSHELSGLNLKIGGSGMKGFYDKILVDFANKYGKKWGARVGGATVGKDARFFTSENMNTEGQPIPIHTFPVTASMKRSVLYEGQPMFESKPTPIPASDHQGSAEMKKVNKLIRNLPKDQKEKVQDSYGRFYKLLRHAMFLTQLQDQNPNNPGIKAYVDLSRLRKMIQNKVQLVADTVSRQWMKAGRKNLVRISDLLRQVNDESERLNRRLVDSEVLAIAQKLGGPTDKIIEVWRTVDASMVKALDLLEAALRDEAIRTMGPNASIFSIAKIEEQMGRLRKVNYFPATRFGEWGVMVKATEGFEFKGKVYRKGQTVVFETRETESASLELRKELEKEYPGQAEVLLRKLTPTERSFMNMPQALGQYLEKHLALTEEQKKDLQQIQYALAPGAGLVKHMIKKQGILGASVDGLRIYNDYFQKLSGHIAKIATSSQIEDAIAKVKADARADQSNYNAQLTAETLEMNYRDMQDAGNEFGALAGGMFHLVFGFNPLAAVVNLTQLPIYTYPYLAKRSNDLIATRAMAIAMKKVGGTLKPILDGNSASTNSIYTGEDKTFFDRAVDEGFLNESLSGELAALASGSMLTKYYEGGVQAAAQMRWLMSKSIMFFKVAEEFNRRVTFQSALEVGRTQGLTGNNLYEFARTAVDMTQFEYSRWNRPKFMRGKASVLFIFKAYLQNFLYFAGTNQGGMRFWLMLVALGGLKAVPGSDDIFDTIDLLGTWAKQFFGMKDPRMDSEKMAREFISSVGVNPDLMMNGLSRYSYGLTGFNTLFGIPFPAADFSTSMQMTRLVPGMRMVKGMAQGTMRWPDAFLTAFTDVAGMVGSTGLNLTRAILEDSPYAGSRLANIPTFSKNLSRAFDMATKGAYRDPDGTTLVDVDLTKPEHVGEIVMQALGKRPTRATAKLESRYMDDEKIGYYLTRREIIITHWATAIGAQDAEAREDARKEWVKFTKTAPPEFVMPTSQLRGELRKLLNKRSLKETGLASNKKYIKMAQDTASLYESPF